MNCVRCTADQKDLDGEAGLQSHEHTQLLMETLDCKTLWDEYGIVGDVLVSKIHSYTSIRPDLFDFRP